LNRIKSNPKELAKKKAIDWWGLEWNLGVPQAIVKFNSQQKKWQRKQVNRFLKG